MRIFVISTLLFLLMVIPGVAGAQDGGLVTCEGPDCNWCTLVDMVNGVIDFIIAMLSVIAIIIMVIAGFRMVTSGGDTGAWESGKKMLTSVIIGIVLVLASWLIVDTLLSMLTGKGINEWLPDDCGGQYVSAPLQSSGTGGLTGTVGAGQYSDAEARQALAAAGIGVNKTAAQGTSLQGMNQATINEVIRIRQACGCEVVVTGGTEGGHAGGTYSHGNGYKVDLRVTEGVNDYILSNYSASGIRSDGASLYRNGNIEYAREGDHWDITVR